MTAMHTDERLPVFAYLVDHARGQKLGRTAVMKLVYFLQELWGARLGYHFTLYTYGPFDVDVLGDLAIANSRGVVTERTVLYTRSYGYEITPGAATAAYSAKLAEDSPKLASECNKVLEAFGLLTAAELELRATILYADRESARANKPVSAGELAERVHRVKPHFSTPTILKSVAEMDRHGWLEGVIPASVGP